MVETRSVVLPSGTELIICFASFVFFRYIVLWLSRAFFNHFECYRNASIAIRDGWDERVGANLHALIATFLAILVIALDQESWQDPLWGQLRGSKSVLLFTVGYLSAGTLLMIENAKNTLEPTGSILAHHLVTAAVMILCTTHEAFLPLTTFRLTAELSSVFVNTRWLLEVYDMKNTRTYVVNGMLMTFTFFLVRILPMPYIYIAFYQHSGRYINMGYVALFPLAGVILDVLNTFWFFKIMRGLLKYVGKLSRKEGKQS